jgi:hypothetical protein
MHMTNVVELSLVTLVSLSANFHSAVQNLQDKNYDKAISAFTAVILAEPSVNDMKELSLLCRAEAYAGTGKASEALRDAVAIGAGARQRPPFGLELAGQQRKPGRRPAPHAVVGRVPQEFREVGDRFVRTRHAETPQTRTVVRLDRKSVV